MNSKHYVIFLRISALFVCAWFVSHDDAHIKQYIRFLRTSTLYVCAWFVGHDDAHNKSIEKKLELWMSRTRRARAPRAPGVLIICARDARHRTPRTQSVRVKRAPCSRHDCIISGETTFAILCNFMQQVINRHGLISLLILNLQNSVFTTLCVVLPPQYFWLLTYLLSPSPWPQLRS